MKIRFGIWALAFAWLVLAPVVGLAAEVEIMTKEELRKILDQDIVSVLDVRKGSSWTSSNAKIRGAHRVEARYFAAQTQKFPRGQTLVLYCS